MNKIILITLLLTLPTLFSCAYINDSKQVSTDTQVCSDLSYNNPQADLKTIDVIFNNCMDNKKKIRDKKQSNAQKSAFASFLIDLFLPSKD